MQMILEKEKIEYQGLLIEIKRIDVDVITASDDPYVDDGYSGGLNWGA